MKVLRRHWVLRPNWGIYIHTPPPTKAQGTSLKRRWKNWQSQRMPRSSEILSSGEGMAVTHMNSQKLWLDLHKIMLAEFPAQMESAIVRPHHSLKSHCHGLVLEEGESSVFENVVIGSIHMPQWISPSPCTSGTIWNREGEPEWKKMNLYVCFRGALPSIHLIYFPIWRIFMDGIAVDSTSNPSTQVRRCRKFVNLRIAWAALQFWGQHEIHSEILQKLKKSFILTT